MCTTTRFGGPAADSDIVTLDAEIDELQHKKQASKPASQQIRAAETRITGMRKKRGGLADCTSVSVDLLAETQENIDSNRRAIAQLDQDILEAERRQADLTRAVLPGGSADLDIASCFPPTDFKDIPKDILAAPGLSQEVPPNIFQQLVCLQNPRRLCAQTQAENKAVAHA